MQKTNRPQAPEPPGGSPELQPAPLSTKSPEQPSSSLPHLIDINLNRISIASHQHDDLYWNSTLEQRGNEPVPEYDARGKVGENGRSYWVKHNWQNTHTAADESENESANEAELPAVQDPSIGHKSRLSSSPTSIYSDDDTHARPPTPIWRKRPNFLSRKRGSSVSGSPDLFIGQSERARISYLNRGGGETVEPVPFRVSVLPSVRRGIEAVARSDPMREGALRSEYKAVPSVAHGGKKESVVGIELGRESMASSLFMKWDPEAPRPSTVELENAYGRYPSRSGSSLHREKHEQPTDEPRISEQPAFREKDGGDQFISDESKFREEDGTNYIHSPTPVKPLNGKSPLPPLNGIPIDMSPDWPPTHALPTPPLNTRRNSSPTSFHSIFHIPPTPSSSTSSHTHPSGLATSAEVQSYLQNFPRSTSLLKTLTLYERTLATQSKSILHLHHQIDVLTQKTEYYEHTLLPQTLTHWTATNKENHAISTALRSAEEENAMLWGLLEFSRKVLSLCWERDEAVLGTARMMRVRQVNRGKVSVLERLVGSFGAGRGGEGREKGKGRGKGKDGKGTARMRGESPGREDLEQLIFVCEQNLRVLGEDLEDWIENLRMVREEREKGKEEEGGERSE